MTAVDERAPVVVTTAGVYPDMPADEYHADPVPGGSLSCSGAKKLLPPSCPAIFKWELDNPPEPTETFEMGHAAHQRVLGVGPELVVVNAERWDTAAVKDEVAAIRAEGKVPLKPSVMAVVDAMAVALHAHPTAAALLGDGGEPESSLFWPDARTDVWRRCRLDWKPAARTGRTIGVDYKTTKSANPDDFAKSAANYGYDMQAAWYLDGLRSLDLAGDDAAFLFIAQEKTAPYVVSVVQLDSTAMRIGAYKARRAIDVYAQCVADDHWPPYAEDVALVSLPFWHEREFEGLI